MLMINDIYDRRSKKAVTLARRHGYQDKDNIFIDKLDLGWVGPILAQFDEVWLFFGPNLPFLGLILNNYLVYNYLVYNNLV